MSAVYESTVFADPLTSSGSSPAGPGRPRRRWEVWRSPAGQPAWARPVLLAIAVLAAALYAWNIANAGYATFYSVAVKSMSVSWKAFFYGALDPSATITIDKLAGSFAPQALSARIFGYHQWSLALPQVIEGVISVLAMYRMVRRWAGTVPGILAALIFALTPIAASMFGHSMEDGALTMCLVLAADQWTRSVIEGRLRSLLWAGFWIGVGFQCKMLQAWMALPALIIGYLICASAPLLKRLADLALFGVVTLVTSLSWILLYTFTPAADRPYIDGSTNNSAWSMVFGYNGLERFGISVPGSVTSGPGVSGGAGGGQASAGAVKDTIGNAAYERLRQAAGVGGVGGPGGAGGGGFGSGWTKLLGSQFGPEIAWLFPLTVLALVCGLAWTWRAKRDDKVRAGFVFWGLWFLSFFLIFSDMKTIPHTAYVASLAPAVAALSAMGIVMFWRAFRAGERRGWMLPVSVALSLVWAVFLWRSYSGFLPWAPWLTVAVGVAAIAVMIWARISRRTALRIGTVALGAGVVAMLVPGSAWAASVLDSKYAGSSFNAGAGPDSGMGGGQGGGPGMFGDGGKSSAARGFGSGMGDRGFGQFPGGAPGGTSGNVPSGASGEAGNGASRGGFGGMMSGSTTLSTEEQKIYNYVSANRDGASYLMAVSSWSEAGPYIMATGQEVMPMGGFSGSVPSPTLAQVQKLVSSGQLKFFLVNSGTGGGGFGGMMGGGNSTSTVSAIDSWVKKTCTAVPAKDYGGTTSSTSSSAARTSAGTSTGGTSPASALPGASSSAQVLYECKG